MDWETYWNHLITEKKLQNKVSVYANLNLGHMAH